jgi:hypothetical protein
LCGPTFDLASQRLDFIAHVPITQHTPASPQHAWAFLNDLHSLGL